MSHSIDKRRLLSLSLILLVAAFFLPSRMVPSAHAQNTGLVCITGSPNASSCDASPPTLGPITAGYNFQVGVFIQDWKSTRLNSSHVSISYAVFCLKKKK